MLPKGPCQELAVKLCESWGLKVDNFCYEQNAVPSSGKIQSLLNSFEWKGETKVVLLIDSKIHSLLIDENIQLATGKNILVVGSLDHLWEQMQRVRVDPARFLLRPIKSSLFRHKLEAAIALSSNTDSHLTVESMRTSFFKEVQFGTRLDFQHDSRMPTHVLVVEVGIIISSHLLCSEFVLPHLLPRATRAASSLSSASSSSHWVQDNPVNQKVAVAMVQKTLGKGLGGERRRHVTRDLRTGACDC